MCGLKSHLMCREQRMKRKILISSANPALLRDFFMNLPSDVSCLSTSEYWEDVKGHILTWKPDVYVCLIEEKSSIQFSIMQNMRTSRLMTTTKVVIITNDEIYPTFTGVMDENVLEILKKPITISEIFATILKRLDEEDKTRELEEEIAKKKAEEEAAIAEENRVKNILVVDDDANVLKLLKSILGDEYNVATMLSGKMATKYLESKECDLILLDYEMPIENGPEVFKKIKEIESAKDIPILFLTGVADKEKIAEVLRLKPQGYLLKPIDAEKLFEAIKENIG